MSQYAPVPLAKNASSKNLIDGSSALPDMSPAILEYLQPMNFGCIEKQLVNGYIQEVVVTKKTLAVKQAFSPKQLMMKPEGQRDWNWFKIHTLSNIKLQPDSVFILGKTRYRIMSLFDYPEYGYIEYDVREDYQGDLPNAGDFPNTGG